MSQEIDAVTEDFASTILQPLLEQITGAENVAEATRALLLLQEMGREIRENVGERPELTDNFGIVIALYYVTRLFSLSLTTIGNLLLDSEIRREQ